VVQEPKKTETLATDEPLHLVSSDVVVGSFTTDPIASPLSLLTLRRLTELSDGQLERRSIKIPGSS